MGADVSDRSHRFMDGAVRHSTLRLPFAVRVSGRVRHYGTLAEARTMGDSGTGVYFDTAPREGFFVEVLP